ncbi:hypothetical protein BCR41DRAFT_402730 [Lobosporangium transversale]|uniref:Uncharacterized protein n=1 Tax=Lobosporangium transversale TaxID=64571 RepID=A0A1Y2FYT8_9FUNG|nr:hypothetical protein BCR41DRAFT_402730 [Lobosporangium transversale]ORY89202.1 hypothetical protein BCR41DRAFT_402730 [Lobosporangium transversale]|eukprot:XP_021875048.1 hypothetical protein BCR41DRAFT_402730 [Lobosporangium transversale]
MAAEKKSPARTELLKIIKKYSEASEKANAEYVLTTSPISDISSTRMSSKSVSTSVMPLWLLQDAFADLTVQLERDPELIHMITAEDLAQLKTCYQALLTAAYYSLYMATKMSCSSEESSWIGAAHYIFRQGLDEIGAFLKGEPSTTKLYMSLEQSFKDFKVESDAHIR